MDSKKAVVLLSGGIDSATTLVIAKADGYNLYALSFDYGQRHRRELVSAERFAKAVGVEKHLTLPLSLGEMGGSALTDDLPVSGEGIEIRAPLIDLTKAEIVKRGSALGLDYSMTFSCYDPTEDGFSCGECDSCRLRRSGFADAGIHDPTRYSTEPGD